jgi:predicted metalloendopeptidase
MHAGIDLQHTDESVRPQDDLHGYLNGGWLAEHEIPADRSVDGAFHALRDAAEQDVRVIIDAAGEGAQPGSVGAKVGDLYASFMDEAAVEARGREPLAADLADIRDAASLPEFLAEMARLQLQGAVGGILAPYVNTDAQDSSRYIVYLHQYGLGLPDETYYHQDSFAEIRAAYIAHVARMLLLSGWSPDEQSAAGAAEAVMAVETAIADRHWSAVQNRDAVATYNRMPVADVTGFDPEVEIRDWLASLGAPMEQVEEVVVRQPSYVESLPELLASQPLDAWRDWLAWAVVRGAASLLD